MADYYDYMCAISEQTDRTVNADTAPELETIDAIDGITDGKDVADMIFTSPVYIPLRRMGLSDEYDASQAYSRILMLYNSGREDFFSVGTENNAVQRTYMAERKAAKDKLIADSMIGHE